MEDLDKSTTDFVTSFCSNEHKECDADLFYFETDYLALKGNPDYLKLMKTLAILETQCIKVCNDIDELEKLKLRVDYEPEVVLKEIMEEKLPFINRIKIAEIPEINWSKYKSLNNVEKTRYTTRRTLRSESQKGKNTKSNKNEIRVRGRLYDEKKPQNFNQLWTLEEQLRLEELLIEYPPEPIENRRWKKIADALGSRTTQQVCSRVQKYFRKLQNAGIPIPGQAAKEPSKKTASSVHKRHKHLLYKPTTFFPGVAMGELESSDSDDYGSNYSSDLSHWDDILKKINEEKLNDIPKVEHIGYKCHCCGKEPISGFRWECMTCTAKQISFCSDCMTKLQSMDPSPHPLIHNFRCCDIFIHPAYNMESFQTDSYLDPNFIK